MVQRIQQVGLIIGTLVFSWYAMQSLHELGHVLHAAFSGGTVVAVTLDPLQFSRTDVSPNPAPVFVAWGGAFWGVFLPLLILLATMFLVRSRMYLAAFFAGFCCIANGSYLGAGVVLEVGDAGDLIQNGVPQWYILAMALPVSAVGLFLWHGLGPFFAIGRGRLKVELSDAILMLAAAISLIVFDVIWTLIHNSG